MRRKPGVPYPKGFYPDFNDDDINEFSAVDIGATLRIYGDKARAGGWLYTCWTSAFRNYLRNGKKYGGVVYRGGREFDPRWQTVLAEARAEEFEAPGEHETPQSYRTRLETWRRDRGFDSQLRARALGALRKVPH